jgi:ABC-type amino acid transport substrate-binding protein
VKLLFLLLLSLAIACSSSHQAPLRVGITPNYPPVIFKTSDGYSGIEADFAKQLGVALNRQVEFVEIPWQEQIPALNANRIDIIMSGMSITPERSASLAFLPSYMTISQMLLVRRNDAAKFPKPGNGYYISSGLSVGVCKGTTGEALARKHLPTNRIESFKSIDDCINALKNNQIDCVLHDSPTIWSYAEGNDPTLTGIYWDFTKEELAWAVSKFNRALYDEVAILLNTWKRNGIASKTVSRWVPYRINYK